VADAHFSQDYYTLNKPQMNEKEKKMESNLAMIIRGLALP
jgi:hypothetical protein